MLEGNLDDFTLPDILRLLAFTSKSGRLAIEHDGGAGRVDLSDGRVREASSDAAHLAIARRLLGAGLVTADDLAAVLRDRTELPSDLELARGLVDAGVVEASTLAEVVREQTVDAVFDLLRWTDGTFRFDRSVDNGGAGGQVLDLAVPVDEVLADATARLESWPSVAERTGDGDAVVTITRPAGERAQVSLSPDGWSMLSFVDGRRSVSELAHLSGQGEFRTRRTLVSLLDEGVVTVGDGGPGQVDRLLADHTRLVELEVALGASPRPTPASVPAPQPARQPAPAVSPSPSPPASTPAAQPAAEAEPAAASPRASRPTMSGRKSRPGPVTVRSEEVAAATEQDDPARGSTPRTGRLRTDPSVDADLVRRLIDGVESL